MIVNAQNLVVSVTLPEKIDKMRDFNNIKEKI